MARWEGKQVNVGDLNCPQRTEYQETSIIARILKRQLRSQNGRSTEEASNDRGGKALRYN